ncbi:MAG: TfoX/Sxy family protein [Burkholderiales bacterium]|nr:TfoX/Sxy family protein [Burkholderiales bacterium]
MTKSLANLGPTSVRMLNGVGIHSEQGLRALGAVAAYFAVKASGANASLNLLWALEGALTGRHWRVVSREDRTSLLMQLDDLERSHRRGGDPGDPAGR